MIDLLRDPLTRDQLVALLAGAPPVPLLPRLGDPAWARTAAHPVVAAWMEPLRSRAERERREPLPPLPLAAYAEVRRTGQRLGFERIYFERRRRIARAALCALLRPDAERAEWLASLAAKLADLGAEAAWALPAHVRTDSGIDPDFIDLFCAETANLVAELLAIFGAALPSALRSALRERLDRQIFANYLEHPERWWWARAAQNWNAVCTQGVAGAALALMEDPALLAEVLWQARQSLPLFLSSFGADGGCPEGPAYWEYGFGWFAVLNEQLECRTAGRLTLFGEDAQVRRIARYGPRVSLPFDRLVNFSDAPAAGLLRPALLAYLGERLDEPLCRERGRFNYRRLAEGPLDLDGERQDFFQFARLFLRCPTEVDTAGEPAPADCLFPDLGVAVAHGTDPRGRRWDFAVKAGHNEEPHNHNDCGSFLLNVDGEAVAAEIGFPEYVTEYFGAPRYTFWAARTLGHSLPIVAGQEQSAGAAARSRFLVCRLDGPRVELLIDLTACYPAAPGRRVIRRCQFSRQLGRLEITDEIESAASEPVETALITALPCRLESGHAILRGERNVFHVHPSASCLIAGVEMLDYSDHDGRPAQVRRIRMIPRSAGPRQTLGYVIVPRDA